MPYIRVPKLSGSHPVQLDNAVQVRLFWQLNEVQCINVIGGRVDGGYTNSQAHATALATAVAGRFTSSGLKARCSATTYFEGVGIRDIRVANRVEFTDLASALPGTDTEDPLPNQLAAVITLRTALAGKSYRGRLYFGGFGEDQNTGQGQIATDLNTALVAFVTGIRTDMATEGITMAVLSQKRYANLPPPADIETWGGAVNDVVAGGIQARDREWDTQRRRRN